MVGHIHNGADDFKPRPLYLAGFVAAHLGRRYRPLIESPRARHRESASGYCHTALS